MSRYKLITLASFLPFVALHRLAKRFDTPGAFELPELGSAFWMDVSYAKWCRRDRRRERRRTSTKCT